MALKGEKKTTVTVKHRGVVYGPWEFATFTGGKQTMGSSKTRKAAGQAKRARSGLDDVENVTVSREDDGEIDLKWAWSVRRGEWTITGVPADEDGNPRAKDSATYTGKLVGQERGEADVDSDEDIDMFSWEFSVDSVVT